MTTYKRADVYRYVPDYIDGAWLVVDTVTNAVVSRCIDEAEAYRQAVMAIMGREEGDDIAFDRAS